MIEHHQLGHDGEGWAEDYLQRRGYEILGKNLRSHFGEIDLVAKKKDRLYFVEIKTRSDNSYGSPLEAISERKKHKIRKTAQFLLLKNPLWRKLIPFFSVLAIEKDEESKPKFEFLEDAFI